LLKRHTWGKQHRRKGEDLKQHVQTSKKGKRAGIQTKVPPKAAPGYERESTKFEERKETSPSRNSRNRNNPAGCSYTSWALQTQQTATENFPARFQSPEKLPATGNPVRTAPG